MSRHDDSSSADGGPDPGQVMEAVAQRVVFD
jgi:hypothetical protein